MIGLGWSASVAAAVEDPDRIEKLVIAAPLGLVPRVRWNRASSPGLQWRNEPNLENTERYLRALAGCDYRPDEQTLRWSCRVGAYCTSLTNMPRIDRAVLRRWRGRPVEVVVGSKDPLVQVDALNKLADDMGAHFVALPEAGHLLAVETPAALASMAAAASVTEAEAGDSEEPGHEELGRKWRCRAAPDGRSYQSGIATSGHPPSGTRAVGYPPEGCDNPRIITVWSRGHL